MSETPSTVRDVVELEQREKGRMTLGDHIAQAITNGAGSMPYVWLHVAWFTAWIAVNLPGMWQFDPYPFTFLTMIVSLEAIFLATFVLISENRQSTMSDQRAKLDLQVNLLAESEVTKLIGMLNEIRIHLGLPSSDDAEVARMEQPTYVHELASEIEKLEEEASQSKT
ncbi:MAG TPA: DUF1003 domain-containing protein [Dehalococcoidia bacterium]|nr:DUF1003 domain-containing protein [Dehalococcoidia bacterium]